MIRMVICIHRRPDLSEEEFRRYWREEHGAKVKQAAETLGVVRYVQGHAVAEELGARAREGRGSAPPYDGIAEIWWDNVESLQAAAGSEEAEQLHRALIEDEAKFVDLGRSTVFFTEQTEIVPG